MVMDNFKIRLKRKAFRSAVQIKDAENSFIQPYKELPSGNNFGQNNSDRMNPHDLFSQYIANIIREDVIFTR